MASIFISYRRGDSGGHSGRLFDALQRRFGDDSLFRDIDDLEPGVDFPEALGRALTQCDAMLVIIGPTWTSVTEPQGRRLDRKDDFVRVEVATALTRKDVRVIPVLVGGATMPQASDLPEDLQSLAARNAIELSDSRWDYDVRRLGDTLAKHLGITETPAAPVASPASSQGRPSANWMKMAAGAGALVVVVVGWLALSGGPEEPTVQDTEAGDAAGAAPAVDQKAFQVGDLEWMTDDRDAIVDWDEATAYCEGADLGGSQWRLPTIEELKTIYDVDDDDGFGNKLMRPFHEGVRSNYLWSSDREAAAAAFALDFKTGEAVSLAVNFAEGAHALCVTE